MINKSQIVYFYVFLFDDARKYIIYFVIQVTVPIIVVGCKLDLRDESQQVSLEHLLEELLEEFNNVATCIECSAATLYQVYCIPELSFHEVMLTYLVLVYIIFSAFKMEIYKCIFLFLLIKYQ